MALPPRQNVPCTPLLQAQDISSVYEILDKEEKGRGAFSKVVVGRHLGTNQMRAVKIMDKTMLVGKKAEMVAHEKEILRRTRHPAIIFLHETIQTADKVYMAMDLMKGDLFEYIVARRKIPEKDTAYIMKQLLSAVEYLHQNSIVHRDIKPENILINTPEDIKLADFGLAKVVQEWDVKSTPCGTSFYIAPEIIRGIESNGARPLCTTKEAVKFVDMWSCGVVMFVMIAGRPPFSGQVKSSAERRALLAKIDRGVLFPEAQWATVSEEAKDLVHRMLTQDPAQRLTATQAVNHKFFKKWIAAPEPAAVDELVLGDGVGRDELAADMNDLQKEFIEVGDVQGDETSYKAEVISGGPATATTKMAAAPKRGGHR